MSYQALLFCPDDKTARVVTQVLTELDFTVEPCNEPFAAVKKLMAQHYDALVVDCDNEQNATLLFKSARNSGSNQTSLAVAVVEGQTGVAKAFRIGANLVLTKPINVEQSKGTLRVARGLLRKADSAKPASAPVASAPAARPSSSSFEAPRPTPPPKPINVSIPAPHAAPTLAPPAMAASGFELEREPDAKLEPSEAALLESMPDTVPAASETAQHVSGLGISKPETSKAETSKAGPPREYPWQPISKPLSEPMASALRRAAEAAGKSTPEPVAPETTDAIAGLAGQNDTEIRPKESWPTGGGMSPTVTPASSGKGNQSTASLGTSKPSSSIQGAAAAAAPAKEVLPFKVQSIQAEPTEIEQPARSKGVERPTRVIVDESVVTSLNISDAPAAEEAEYQEESDSGGSSKTPFIGVAVILLAVAGYFGWSKMHSVDTAPAIQQQTAPAETAPTPQATVVGSPVTQPGTGSTATSPHGSTEATTPGSGKPSPTKSSSASATSTIEVTPVGAETAPEPLVVRNGPSAITQPKPAVQESVAAPAPESLGVSSNTSEKTISGIASAMPVNVPRQAPQTVKVSQGVLQGMLVKKVQPVYPVQAQQRRLQGSVEMQATIGKDGNITAVKVLSGDPQLARAATDAVRQWKYKPYVLNGEPVEIQSQVTVNFKLP